MSAFFRLHPSLQHAIVHDLGWRELRAVQELSIEAVLDGCNAIVLAPTAGGKTEAAAFPVLSRILTEEIRPVAALYVCPIRALLNNQEQRLRGYAQMVGLDAFKWHGDVAATARRRFLRDPTHLLMTTPESLEVLLIGKKAEAARLFAQLSLVVVDEVHAFASDDRGAHLASLLERLCHFCGRDLQRIGLSATVGNPDEVGAWLQGSSQRPRRLVDPPRPLAERDLSIDFCEEVGEVAVQTARISRGKKSLVFVESRSQAERVAASLTGSGVEVFVHHSAVSRADRQAAEERFLAGSNTAIVCTSTMELGIDVGDLDHVVQVEAPSTLASFLQRLGRTGRRPGTRSNATFLATTPESLLQATALLRLLDQGFIEDVRPARAAAHILAHQILALTLQEGGVSRHRILDWVAPAAPFQALDQQDVELLVDTMLERNILHESDGRLSLGNVGERVYGRKNFLELYAVFSAPSVLRVVHGSAEIGAVDAVFLATARDREGPVTFRLGARAWQVTSIEWGRGVCHVVPAAQGRVPTWLGAPTSLSPELCAAMKQVLAEEATVPRLTPRAAEALSRLRDSYDGIATESGTALENDPETGAVRWHTFAGAAANRLLALGLARVGGGDWSAGNLALKSKHSPGLADGASYVEQLLNLDWHAMALAEASGAELGEISKFEMCLPDALRAKLLAERLYDAEGAARVAKAGLCRV